MNDGSIGSTFHDGIMQVEVKPPTVLTSTQLSSLAIRPEATQAYVSADQIADVALSFFEYVKQYAAIHKELNYKQVYLLEQCVVWQRLSVHLGWQCDNVRAL